MQSTFAIRVDPKDITTKNFDFVNKLVAFIRRKQVSRAQSGGESRRHADPDADG